MLFYEPLFLFIFGPAVYLAYVLLGARPHMRALLLLVASIIFYSWREPAFIFVVFASVAMDLYVARRISMLKARAAPQPAAGFVAAQARGAGDLAVHDSASGEKGAQEAARRWLAFGVAANVAILVYYKYTGFLALNLDALLRALTLPGLNIPAIALPIGVSFIVFEKITYLVDVYRGVTAPARGPLLYALYVFFFPKLLAGPIIKYHDIVGQFEACPRAGMDDFVNGFSRFMLGVVKKVLIADVMASGADALFARDAASLGFAGAWMGVAFFTLQIYFDFSSYSDMAIGLARMFGFRLLENFNMPYIATSVTDFWRRWHMSLTGWIREYLYFPLGGNRKGEVRTYLNLWICFLASGVWHGAAWPFVFWGVYNGAFLVLDRLFLLDRLKRLPDWLANIVTLLVVMVGWAVFRAASMAQASAFLSVMMRPWAAGDAAVVAPPQVVAMAFVAGGVCILQRLGVEKGIDWLALARRHAFLANSALALLFLAALAKGLAEPFKPFIYFRF
jgi:alginate O-acetyltransferase complex protein AlgI